MFCGIDSYNRYYAAVRHRHSSRIVLPFVYCHADDTLFEVGPDIRCSMCQVAAVVTETIQLVLSQIKNFLSQSMEN